MRKLDEPTDDGWIVHVYGRNRRLLYSLEPSHGWAFLLGTGLGLVLAIICFNIARYTPAPRATEPSEVPAFQVD